MDQIIDFLLSHWILSSIFLSLFGFYLIIEILYSQQNNKITPQQAVDLINHDHAIVLDIRSSTEFATNHVIDAINIPSATITEQSKKIQKYAKKPVIIVATKQTELKNVINLLKQQGFQQILQLAGGMHEWLASGLPTTSSKT